MAASENLSDAATLIFRRYFRSSSLQAFCKVSVLKTSVKFLGKHICWILFSVNLQTLSLKFYQMKDYIIFFNEKVFYLENIFLTAEAVVRRCSQKKVFLEILQNLQENTCATESFFKQCCRPQSAKFLRTPFFTEHVWWLLL